MIVSDADIAQNSTVEEEPKLNFYPNRLGAIYPSKGCYIDHDTLEDNMFVDIEFSHLSKEETTQMVQGEFDKFVSQLKKNGIQIEMFEQETDAPDSVCTDWFMTVRNELFPKGVLILGAMKNKQRRRERSQKLIDTLEGYYEHIIDLKFYEEQNLALELQGSLVCDWKNAKIYCSLSTRSDIAPFEYLIEELNKISQLNTGKEIKGISFTSHDWDDNQIYHTDIMLAILDKHILICSDMIKDEDKRQVILEELSSPELNDNPREIITISEEECLNMCANVIFCKDKNDNSCVIMSERAMINYHRENRREIKRNYKVIKADLRVLEKISGASAKSLLAAIN
ncbi:unnamed protein product [Moneuplotes crassus]|uniref:Uncharacterized protein n=2 Tax=Euplotes crassus TaxID=5936 RepID=A0AAD1UIB8_EUPCR|nr:unnamed protein product [Moneuplotes crassus]